MRTVLILAALLGLSVSVPTFADELVLPQASPTTLAVPSKGMSMAAVSRAFGEPLQRHPAVGGSSPQQPPITRWDYAGFSVFFEYDHVVHSVVEGQPAAVHHQDQLHAH